MLQAFIDDSKTFGEPRIFVLGGYLATAETWAQFTDEWQRFLRMDPRIEYFKLREAMHQTGEFDGREERLCIERITLMRNIIEKYDLGEFSIGFLMKDYETGFVPYCGVPVLKNPYYFAAVELGVTLAQNIQGFGFERQNIEFIFDEQVKEKGTLLDGWDFALQLNKKNPHLVGLFKEDLAHRLPAFRNDKEVLPLQAADMHATYVRMLIQAASNGEPFLPLPGKTRELKGLFLTWNAEKFRDHAVKQFLRLLEMKDKGIL
jgi:hypothetical protein